MIQARPTPDDAEFPPFQLDDVSPDAVVWLDELFDEEEEDESSESVLITSGYPFRDARRRRCSRDYQSSVLKTVWSASDSEVGPSDANAETSSSELPGDRSARGPAAQDEPLTGRTLKRIAPRKKSSQPVAVAAVPTSRPMAQVRPRTDHFGFRRRRRLLRILDDLQEDEVFQRDRIAVSAAGAVKENRSPLAGPIVSPPVELPALELPRQNLDRHVSSALNSEASVSADKNDLVRREDPRESSNHSEKPRQVVVTERRKQPVRDTPPVADRSKRKKSARHQASKRKEQIRQIPVLYDPAAVRRSGQNADEDEPQETYSEWFQRAVVRNRWTTWFTTFYVHWIILLLMAAIVVSEPETAANIVLQASLFDAEPEDVPPIEITPAEIDPVPLAEAQPTESANSMLQDLEQMKAALSSPTYQAADVTKSLSDIAPGPPAAPSVTDAPARTISGQSPAPGYAVSGGSFSTWTEPANPVAGEPYRIIIQIRLPDGVTAYDVSDLSGMVVGSDGYRKPIPGSKSGALFVKDGYVRFIVPIVSADAEVNDTIYIRSRMLRENQKLVLKF